MDQVTQCQNLKGLEVMAVLDLVLQPALSSQFCYPVTAF